MQHIAVTEGLIDMAGTVESDERWRVELAELLARAEAEGRNLTDGEWLKFCELLPPSDRAAMARCITSKISLGQAVAPCGASLLGLLGPMRG